MSNLGDDLRLFIDASPSPFHAVAEMARRLEGAGFTEIFETDRWSLAPGAQHYVIRDGGSIVAFRVGTGALADTGIVGIGTHSDSPTFKVRTHHDVTKVGYKLVGVEPYGAALAHTWLDRELTIAGRVVRSDGATSLVTLGGPTLRMPSLAIHLDRSVREKLVLDPQRHLVPIAGLAEQGDLLERLGAPDAFGWDLVLSDTQPSASTGSDWIAAPRLDNLGSCHAATHAIIDAAPAAHTQVFIANDHEEVGSSSAEGANGSLLADVLLRLTAATGDVDPQAFAQTIARSRFVSADMAHAIHPNYADRHEPSHTPLLGGGPVIKHNANQSYATDARTEAWFAGRAADVGVPVQHFFTRADLPCGSTIGPLTATRIGIATVDVGNAMLSMHSCRELTSGADVPLMITAMTACLS